MKRKGMSQKLRFSIFERDKFICQYCGRTPDKEGVVLQVDHIVSVKNGGDNNPNNLITSCFDCNIGKGAKTTIKGKMTPKDIAEELAKTQDKLEQVIAMNKATKKIQAINIKINKERYSWLENELEDFNVELIKKIVVLLNRSFPDVSREKVIEAIIITKEKNDSANFKLISDFVKYFRGVLKNIILSQEEQNILRMYNSFLYSKSCKMYSQTKKFILDNTDFGEDFHKEVLDHINDCIKNKNGQTFAIRDQVSNIFNRTEFTIYKQSEININIHICDAIQMLADEYLP